MHVRAAMGDTVPLQGHVICLNNKNVSSMSPMHNAPLPRDNDVEDLSRPQLEWEKIVGSLPFAV